MNSVCHSYSGLLLIAAVLLLTVGCSTVPKQSPGEEPPERTYEQYVDPTADYPIDLYDPLEGFNRAVYRFNAGFDRYVFLPAVDAYETVIPELVQFGLSNFFDNVSEARNFVNNALQLKPKATAETALRFAINTLFGLAGILDPATDMGLVEQREDFGQTLGFYGVGNGPYLVLPVFGPSNVRDGIGIGANAVLYYGIDPLDFGGSNEEWEWPYNIARSIDTRRRIGFRYYETGSPYEYELVRYLYTKKREIEIAR